MKNQANILIIEDDKEFRETLAKALKKEGYLVDSVSDSKKAFEFAKSKIYDVVVSDVRLPGGVDGIEVIRKIKDINPEKTSSIVITGYADAEAPIRAIKVKVDDYIAKPFAIELFLNSIKKNLKILKLERQERNYIRQLKAMRKKLNEYSAKVNSGLKNKKK